MSQMRYGRCCAHSATLRGVTAVPVEVEVAISKGLPGFHIVGMPDAAIQEAKVRIKAACSALGFSVPAANIVVNLAPGSLRKTGSGFDLPIAMALLAATGQIEPNACVKNLVVGELSLQGGVKEVPGLLAYALTARELGLGLISAPVQGSMLAVEGVTHWALASLSGLRTGELSSVAGKLPTCQESSLDFSDLAGHDIAKRALQIAATGQHGVLMMGPPGSGKTMLASRLPSILPPLSDNQLLESAVIHSVAQEPLEPLLGRIRPFRAPHHSATLAGLVGGGNPTRPGEVTLAHNGVLFLDELAEFKPSVLQGIRQPLESGKVTITRADGNVTFPARFSLIAATNPCPCGYYGDKEKDCRCTVPQVRKYQNRIGGPILDRIDMSLEVCRLPAGSVLDTGKGTSSECLRQGVLAGSEFRSWRKASMKIGGRPGATGLLMAECNLGATEEEFLSKAAASQNLSGRAIMRVLSVARTIADLDECQKVQLDHVSEALSYRLPDWG